MYNLRVTGSRWPVIFFVLIVISMTVSMPALAMGSQSPLADPWVTSTVDTLEGGGSLSLAVDANGRPHAS
jgi:hypothetical protein